LRSLWVFGIQERNILVNCKENTGAMKHLHIGRRQVGIRLVVLALFAAPVATADLLDSAAYTIAFTGTGVMPTAASFTYDPDTATFSSFLVTWDSLSFDLTNDANTLSFIGPVPSCFTGLTGGAASFVVITKSCPLPPSETPSEIFWFGDTEVDHSARFVFSYPDPPPSLLPSTELDAVLLSGPAAHDVGSGGWITTEVAAPVPAAVPEPGSLLLLATMCALAGTLALFPVTRGKRSK
jgi:hypothetical protein